MKNVRVDIDNAYKDHVKRLNALIIVNGSASYESFVRELNQSIEKLNNTLASRKDGTKLIQESPVETE